MSKYKISAISYLNTKPFLYGLNRSDYIRKNSLLQLEPPSVSGEKLLTGEVDIGLIPIAFFPKLKQVNILSETCIATDQYMPSVLLLSQVPINKIEKIWLDYQSATTVGLVKILAKNYWKISPRWLKSNPGYEDEIKGKTAGIIIGDRALKFSPEFTYNIDLSSSWYDFTGLPFVFACWVSNKDIDPEFIMEFNKALFFGIDRLDEVIRREEKKHSFPNINVKEYLKEYLKFKLDDAKKEGMKQFLRYFSSV